MREQSPGGAAPEPLQVSLFGALRVTTPSAVLGARGFPGVKPRQLLEVLLCHRGHAVSKSLLAELLWGDALPRDHAATLETYVSVLRRTLAPGRPAAQSVVVTEHGGYRLGPAGVVVDLDAFDDHRQQALSQTDPAAALAVLHSALQLVRGPVLEDEPYAAWAEPLRQTYRERHVTTLVDAGRLSLVVGDAPAALGLAHRAVALQPLAESAYQVLMTAAYALQRQDEALAAFDRCRRLLADELGVDPVQETVALHLSILRHEPVGQPTPGAPPVPSTVHVPDPRPGHEDGLLLGRESELALLEEGVQRARSGRMTLAVVTGPVGIGKTSLVQRLAQCCGLPVVTSRCSSLESGFPYLALSLALQTLRPETRADRLPELHGLVEGKPPLDQLAHLAVMEDLAGRLRREAPLLLWLDDAQWADPATITTLAYLQRRCPDTQLLVVLSTDRSRSTLGSLRGLRPDLRIDLGPLSRACVEAVGHEELFALTGGHPLYVDGWLRARRSGLPQSFGPELCERVLMSCWDAGPVGYRLLSAAAGLEQAAFSPALLASLVEVEPAGIVDCLDGLVERGLFCWVADELAFSTPALRSILAAALSPARRAFVLDRTRARPSASVPVPRATLDRRLTTGA